MELDFTFLLGGGVFRLAASLWASSCISWNLASMLRVVEGGGSSSSVASSARMISRSWSRSSL